MDEEGVVVLIVYGVAAVVGIGVWLAIQGFVGWLHSRALKALPASHRKLEPWQPYLLMIPCFNLIWNFIVYLQVAEGYEQYFASRGQPIGGNLKTFGLIYCILAVMSGIPYLGACFGFIAFVFLIIFHVQLWELVSKAQRMGDYQPSTFG